MWRAEPLCILAGALILIVSIGFADRDAGRAYVAYEDPQGSVSSWPGEVIAWIDTAALATAFDARTPASETASSTDVTLASEKPEAAPAASVATPAAPAVTAEDLDNSSTGLLRALVNILCFAPAGSGIRSTSASGVIVSP